MGYKWMPCTNRYRRDPAISVVRLRSQRMASRDSPVSKARVRRDREVVRLRDEELSERAFDTPHAKVAPTGTHHSKANFGDDLKRDYNPAGADQGAIRVRPVVVAVLEKPAKDVRIDGS